MAPITASMASETTEGRGAGRTKKAAEQLAAYRGICQLKKTDQ